ncbi:MAG: VOC family protein [Gemmatimonadota bacterium]|nr:VOC family protein [Gemmatimonadota bacterium]
MLRVAVWTLAVLAAVLVLDRVLLACEARGWINYRRRGLSRSGAAFHSLTLQAIFDPAAEHLQHVQYEEVEERDDSGDPPPPDAATPYIPEAAVRVAEAGTLHHTCFVVHDVERAAAALAASLGLKPWNVWTIEPVTTTVHGRNVPYSFRVALAQVGDSSYELLAPLAGASVYVEHLATKGEGFHHTCLAYPSLAAMRAAKDELARQGRDMIQSGGLGDAGEFCYFDIAETGAVLELLYLKELPPPEKTIG